MEEIQNVTQNQSVQPASPINWDRLEAQMASIQEIIKETSEQMKETDRKIKETSEQMKKTDCMVKETSAQMKETDRLMKESRKETDRRIEESRIKTDRQLEETGKKIDQLSEEMRHLMKRTSSLDNEWGRFLEEMCVPSCIDIFKKEGIGITQRYADVTHAKDAKGVEMEVDVILCNTTEAVVIEVKSNCTQKHIDRFIDQMQHFKRIFHPFDRYKVYAAIVGMKFQNGVEKYARDKGLYVIRCTPEGVFSLSERPVPALSF